MLSVKSLKRILEHQAKRKLLEEGFIEDNLPSPEQIELVKVSESNGNYHNDVIVHPQKYNCQKR